MHDKMQKGLVHKHIWLCAVQIYKLKYIAKSQINVVYTDEN